MALIRYDNAVVSGWHVLHQLRADAQTGTIPLIVWSGDVEGLEEKRQWLEDHDVAVMTKPFDIEDLYAVLDRLLTPDGLPARDAPVSSTPC